MANASWVLRSAAALISYVILLGVIVIFAFVFPIALSYGDFLATSVSDGVEGALTEMQSLSSFANSTAVAMTQVVMRQVGSEVSASWLTVSDTHRNAMERVLAYALSQPMPTTFEELVLLTLQASGLVHRYRNPLLAPGVELMMGTSIPFSPVSHLSDTGFPVSLPQSRSWRSLVINHPGVLRLGAAQGEQWLITETYPKNQTSLLYQGYTPTTTADLTVDAVKSAVPFGAVAPNPFNPSETFWVCVNATTGADMLIPNQTFYDNMATFAPMLKKASISTGTSHLAFLDSATLLAGNRAAAYTKPNVCLMPLLSSFCLAQAGGQQFGKWDGTPEMMEAFSFGGIFRVFPWHQSAWYSATSTTKLLSHVNRPTLRTNPWTPITADTWDTTATVLPPDLDVIIYMHSEVLDHAVHTVTDKMARAGLASVHVSLLNAWVVYADDHGSSLYAPSPATPFPLFASCNPVHRAFAYDVLNIARAAGRLTETNAELVTAVTTNFDDPTQAPLRLRMTVEWSKVIASLAGTLHVLSNTSLATAVAEVKDDLSWWQGQLSASNLIISDDATETARVAAAISSMPAAPADKLCSALYKDVASRHPFAPGLSIVRSAAPLLAHIADIESLIGTYGGTHVVSVTTDLPQLAPMPATATAAGINADVAHNFTLLVSMPLRVVLGEKVEDFLGSLPGVLAAERASLSTLETDSRVVARGLMIGVLVVPVCAAVIILLTVICNLRPLSGLTAKVDDASKLLVRADDGTVVSLLSQDSEVDVKAVLSDVAAPKPLSGSTTTSGGGAVSKKKLPQDDAPRDDGGYMFSEYSALNTAYRTLLNTLGTFARYLPADVVERVVAGKLRPELAFREVPRVTVLFADIEDFTGLCQRHVSVSSRLSTALELYFTLATTLAISLSGSLDKFIGDALMVTWGALKSKGAASLSANAKGSASWKRAGGGGSPTGVGGFPLSPGTPATPGTPASGIAAVSPALSSPRHAAVQSYSSELCSVMTAVGLQRITHMLTDAWMSLVHEGISVRVGCHVGPAMAGHIGSSRRMNFTALGTTVNVASRLEASNKTFGTYALASSAVIAAAAIGASSSPPIVRTRRLGVLRVKGQRAVLKVEEPYALRPDATEALDVLMREAQASLKSMTAGLVLVPVPARPHQTGTAVRPRPTAEAAAAAAAAAKQAKRTTDIALRDIEGDDDIFDAADDAPPAASSPTGDDGDMCHLNPKEAPALDLPHPSVRQTQLAAHPRAAGIFNIATEAYANGNMTACIKGMTEYLEIFPSDPAATIIRCGAEWYAAHGVPEMFDACLPSKALK